MAARRSGTIDCIKIASRAPVACQAAGVVVSAILSQHLDAPMTDDARRQTASRFASAYLRLRPKHRAFLEAYFRSRDAEQAAIAAGYVTTSARRSGCRLLRHCEISAALLALEEAVAAECRASAEVIVAAFRRVFGPAIAGHIGTDADGETFLQVTGLTPEQTAALCEWIER
jgi:hypothetical protein